jgi:hypothetical protein
MDDGTSLDLTPFMAFSMAYHENKVHKMLDPCFKNIKNIQDFMGNV